MSDARKIMRRLDALAEISDVPGKITRTFASPAMQRANGLVARWMRSAGMQTRIDAIGNLFGHYAGTKADARILLLGSHLDTVPDAGKFDGPLGVLLAIACVEHLHRRKIRLPFAIEVVGFADEEGVRFQTAFLGSGALAGVFNGKDLLRRDAEGVSMAEAIRRSGGHPEKIRAARLNPEKLLGYVEAHIEQGPLLEKNRLAVGIVTAITGQTRTRITFSGRAGHAGTTPTNLRRDALCAAAEFVLAVEHLARKTPGLVATVGEISAKPGAGNVIPGEVRLSLDVRHVKDSLRKLAQRTLKKIALEIARRRKMRVNREVVHETAAVKCSEKLSMLLGQAVKQRQKRIIRLASGAGHDAAMMAGIVPVAMLFLRCRGGVSHHPDESVKPGDVKIALDILNGFLQSLAGTHCPTARQTDNTHYE